MPTPLTDADKVIRNDTGLAIVQAIQGISAPAASNVPYDNTTSGLTADDVQDAIDELSSEKMEKVNPVGTGTFSFNRKANTTVGAQSVAIGYLTEASGDQAYAEGRETIASGNQSHAEGYSTTASATRSHAEGGSTVASGQYSHAEGQSTTASGNNSHTEGLSTTASGNYSHAEGGSSTASGGYSHVEGTGTTANHRSQHVFGEYNDPDPSTAAATARGNYVEIVGKGSNNANRSNARTLDWSGNETLAGDLKINGTQSLSTLWTTLSGFTVLSGKSGSIASFSTDIADKLFSCYVNVTAIQAGSGTPSPRNPRAISGWSSANITKFGKNVYPVKVGRDLFADNRGSTHTTNDDILTITMASENNSGVYGGTGTATNNTICQTIKKFSGSFVFSLYAKASANNSDVYFGFGSFGNTVATLSTSWQRVELPLTLDSAIHTLNFYNRSGSAITVDVKDVQIEQALSMATSYEEYKSTTVIIPFDDTYYGGVLDVTNGKLTVTKKYWEYDGSSDEDWQIVSGTSKFYTAQQDVVDTYNANKYSNIYPFSGSATSSASVTVDKSFYTQRNETDLQYNRIWVYNSDYSTVEQFKTALSNQHLQIVADLITPVIVNLTPKQITTLLGSNNIYADCGDIDLRYLETIGNKL